MIAGHSADCSVSVNDDGVWVDDQLWAVVLGVASPSQAESIKAWLANRTVAYESQPTRWSSKIDAKGSGGRYAETWFGRLGLGDVLMRYNNFSQPDFGLTLRKSSRLRNHSLDQASAVGYLLRDCGVIAVRRISAAFTGTQNIMESYTMDAKVGSDPGASQPAIGPSHLPRANACRSVIDLHWSLSGAGTCD